MYFQWTGFQGSLLKNGILCHYLSQDFRPENISSSSLSSVLPALTVDIKKKKSQEQFFNWKWARKGMLYNIDFKLILKRSWGPRKSVSFYLKESQKDIPRVDRVYISRYSGTGVWWLFLAGYTTCYHWYKLAKQRGIKTAIWKNMFWNKEN